MDATHCSNHIAPVPVPAPASRLDETNFAEDSFIQADEEAKEAEKQQTLERERREKQAAETAKEVERAAEQRKLDEAKRVEEQMRARDPNPGYLDNSLDAKRGTFTIEKPLKDVANSPAGDLDVGYLAVGANAVPTETFGGFGNSEADGIEL